MAPVNTNTQFRLGHVARRQGGASLLVALLFLSVLLIFGTYGAQNASIFERVSGNSRDRDIAFNAAESALRDAESYLFTVPNLPVPETSLSGVYSFNDIPSAHLTLTPALQPTGASATNDTTSTTVWADPQAIAFLKAKGFEYGAKTGVVPLAGVTQQPRYILEYLLPVQNRPRTYRITAIGFGRSNGLVVLQTYFTPPQDTALDI